MVQEGVLRDYYSKDGIYHDCLRYSMLRREYFSFKKSSVSCVNSKFSLNEIIQVVSLVLSEDQITIDSNMCDTPGWTSLNHMAIVLEVSNKSGVKFSPIDIAQATSIRSIFSIIEKNSVFDYV